LLLLLLLLLLQSAVRNRGRFLDLERRVAREQSIDGSLLNGTIDLRVLHRLGVVTIAGKRIQRFASDGARGIELCVEWRAFDTAAFTRATVKPAYISDNSHMQLVPTLLYQPTNQPTIIRSPVSYQRLGKVGRLMAQDSVAGSLQEPTLARKHSFDPTSMVLC
jgi:hypothetical protein